MIKYFEVHLLNSLRVRSKIIRVLVTTFVFTVLFIAATICVLWVTLAPASLLLGAEGAIVFFALGLFLIPALWLGFLIVAVVALVRFAKSVQDISPHDVRLSREGKILIAAFLVVTTLFIVLRHGESIRTAVVVNAAALLHIPALCSLEERHATDCVRGAVPNGKTEYEYCHLVHPNDVRNCKLQGAVASGNPQSCDQFSQSELSQSYQKCMSHFAGAPEHVAYCSGLEEQVRRDSRHLKAMLMAQCAFKDPNVTAPYGVTPLMLSLTLLPYERPSSEYVRSLIASGAETEVSFENGDSLFLHAVKNKVPDDMLAALLENGADPNVTDAEGRTPLHILAERYTFRAETIELLLRHGADANAREPMGETPLMTVLKTDEPAVRVVRALLENGAETNVSNDAGETPLIIVVGRIPSWHMVQLLQKYGATIEYRNIHGQTFCEVNGSWPWRPPAITELRKEILQSLCADGL